MMINRMMTLKNQIKVGFQCVLKGFFPQKNTQKLLFRLPAGQFPAGSFYT